MTCKQMGEMGRWAVPTASQQGQEWPLMTCKQMSGVGFPETGLTKPDFRSDITYNLTLWTCVLYYHPICYHLLTPNQSSQWETTHTSMLSWGHNETEKFPSPGGDVNSHFSLCKWCWNSHKITPTKRWEDLDMHVEDREGAQISCCITLFLNPLIQESLIELGAGLVASQAPGIHCLHLSTGLQDYT